MKISLTDFDNPNNHVGFVVDATDSGDKVMIYDPNTGEGLECKVYTFEGINVITNTIQPFVCFCKGGVGVFCNNIRYAKYECLDGYSQMLIRWYVKSLVWHGYKDNFTYYRFGKTPDKTDDDLTRIIWKTGDEYSYQFSKDWKTLTIVHDGWRSRLQCITGVMNDMFKCQIENYFDLWVSNLHLDGKVYSMDIADPKNNEYVSGREVTQDKLLLQDSITPGVNAMNYSTDYVSEYETLITETRKKSYIVYSPLVYYLSAREQKLLIAHELCHCKIGNLHGHDSYFWYMFEFATGYKRTADMAYRLDQEQEDTENWNSLASDPKYSRIYGLTTNVLIRDHKEAVENDEEW